MDEVKYATCPRFGICLDWETSGSDWADTNDQHIKKYQGLAFGAVVFTFDDLKPVKTLYREIKFLPEEFAWSLEAEKIHGLSREYLAENGVTQEEAAIDLGELILEYWGPEPLIPFLGHNTNYDVSFTRQLMEKFNIMPKLFHVHLDTSGLGLLTLGIYRSSDLFHILGLPTRKEHKAIDDALLELEAARRIREIVQIGLGI